MVRVTITLRQEDLDEVDQLADKLTIPRSAAVRILIMEGLEQREPQKMTIKVEKPEPPKPA